MILRQLETVDFVIDCVVCVVPSGVHRRRRLHHYRQPSIYNLYLWRVFLAQIQRHLHSMSHPNPLRPDPIFSLEIQHSVFLQAVHAFDILSHMTYFFSMCRCRRCHRRLNYVGSNVNWLAIVATVLSNWDQLVEHAFDSGTRRK